jgi:hypothetical protein
MRTNRYSTTQPVTTRNTETLSSTIVFEQEIE